MTDHKAKTEFEANYPKLFTRLKGVKITDKMRGFYREYLPEIVSDSAYEFWRHLLTERKKLGDDSLENDSFLEDSPFLRLFLANTDPKVHEFLFKVNHTDFAYYPEPALAIAQEWLRSPLLGSNTVDVVLACKDLDFEDIYWPLARLTYEHKTLTVKALIDDLRVWTKINKSQLLSCAVRAKSVEIVQMILNKDRCPGRFEWWGGLSESNHSRAWVGSCSLMEQAVIVGDIPIICLLLSDGRIDPTAGHCKAAATAFRLLRADILEVFIRDGRTETFVLKAHTEWVDFAKRDFRQNSEIKEWMQRLRTILGRELDAEIVERAQQLIDDEKRFKKS